MNLRRLFTITLMTASFAVWASNVNAKSDSDDSQVQMLTNSIVKQTVQKTKEELKQAIYFDVIKAGHNVEAPLMKDNLWVSHTAIKPASIKEI